jgi:hypothetical protein
MALSDGEKAPLDRQLILPSIFVKVKSLNLVTTTLCL